jgi:hypothetical protein
MQVADYPRNNNNTSQKKDEGSVTLPDLLM